VRVVSEAQRAPEPRLEGILEREGRSLAVTLSAASRLALRARFDGPPPPDRTVFDRLAVSLGGRDTKLGRCRYVAEAGDAGRLVFLDDVYDARALVFDRKLIDLKSAFQSVPAVLGQKEVIRPSFRAFVSDLTYDLSVWKRFFDEQDAVISSEPPDAAEASREALIATAGRSFMSFLDRQIERLMEETAGFTKEEHERHGFYLRRQAWPYIQTAPFMLRTNQKPFGYAGDAEMMKYVYENRYQGDSIFGQLMHKHPVEAPGSQAVRNRRRLVPRTMREVAERFPSRQPFHFFSVAAGPAWELQDVYQTPADVERFRCSLLDQDPHALAAARENVARIEAARGARIDVSWHQESVRTMLRTADLPARFGRHQFVYSMGLFDYLTPPVARAVLRCMYDLLLPGGMLLVGNYHVANPSRVYMEYWLDWALFLRSEESFRALADGLPGASLSLSFDDSRCQMFMAVEKSA
jgi:extracellular factor (EF) 3-hydroxypalmitic acid methyl ester biosynthesis protein